MNSNMLLDRSKEKILKYNLGPSQISEKDKKCFKKTKEKNFDTAVLMKDSCDKIPLYKIEVPGTKDESYIFLTNKSEVGNILYIPDQVFDVLENCNGISFEYQPCYDIGNSIKSKFKDIIDRSIAIIEFTYYIILKYSNSNNFDIYLSLAINMLDHYCHLLSSFSKIKKLKDSIGNNLDYIIFSRQILSFGMIDPQGCLIFKQEEFTFKNLNFIPVVNSNSSIQFNDNDALNLKKIKKTNLKKSDNKKNKSKSKKDKIIELEADSIKKWAIKIMTHQNHLFIVDSKIFLEKNGLKDILKLEGYNITRIDKPISINSKQ